MIPVKIFFELSCLTTDAGSFASLGCFPFQNYKIKDEKTPFEELVVCALKSPTKAGQTQTECGLLGCDV